MENYVVCMFIGHGTFLTNKNKEGIAELIPITSPLELSICTFAPPAETCFYPPEALLSLKNTLIGYSKKIMDEDVDRSFQQLLLSAQQESGINMSYSAPIWSGFFNKRPEFSELCIKSNKYFEKQFSSAEIILAGAYIIKSNIRSIPTILPFSDQNFQTLSSIITFFNNHNVKKIFILDATCSVFLGENGYIEDEKTIRRLRHDLLKLPQFGGKKIHSKKKLKKKKKRHFTKRKKYLKKNKKSLVSI